MTTPSKHRNPWPIAICAFFGLFFSSLVSFIVFASTQHVDLVRGDYYEEEIRFQLQLDRVERTARIGQPLAIAYDRSQECITVRLPASHAGQSSGQIHLYRPSDARLDKSVPLQIDNRGTQRLDARRLRPGLWRVRVEWTVAGQEYYFDQRLVVRPSHS